MAKGLPVFSDFEAIDKHVAKFGSAGLTAIRTHAASNFHMQDKTQQAYIRDWLALYDATAAEQQAQEARELTKRNVAAAENAATAAVESARTSGQSARAAMFAAVVAFAALVVSICAYFKQQ